MTTPPTSLPGGGSSDPANAGVANHTMKHVAATETRPNFFMPPDPFSLIDNPEKPTRSAYHPQERIMRESSKT